MSHFFSLFSGRLLVALAVAGASLLPPATANATTAAGLFSPQAVPTVSSFSPTNGIVGTMVNIVGTGFINTTTVSFNNTATTFSVIDDQNLTAEVPAGASSGRIRVTNTDGTVQSSNNFIVILPPTISSLSPSSGTVGTSVTVIGLRLGNASDVTLSGVSAAFTQIDTEHVSFVVPGGANSGLVTITTPDGIASSASQFTVRPPAPTVISFTPFSGAAGLTSVTITGANFVSVSDVRFGGASASIYNVVNSTTITATVPAGASTGRIRVVTPGGTGISATNFQVVGVPTISSFTPTTTAVGGSVTISGTNFVNVSAVRFNGTAAASFTVNSRQRITATVAVGTTTGSITVTTPSGTATSGAVLTINAATATITNFSPTSGNARTIMPVVQGTLITITGTNFPVAANITSVSFGGVTQPTFTRVSATSITARVPVGAVTGRIRIVTTTNGTAQSATNFIVNNNDSNPTITLLPAQRQCANNQLAVSYVVGDAQTLPDDLVVTGTSPGNGTVIVFTADNTGSTTNRTALISAVNTLSGGITTMTLTVTDGANRTASTTFSVTFDPLVTADAGSDQTVAANQLVTVTGTATGANSTMWTTTGSGTFDNPAAVSTNYNPSQADYLAGSVVLLFSSFGSMGSACPTAGDGMTVAFFRTDRVVTGNELLGGVYNNVLIVPGGVATVGGALDVANSLETQNNSSLIFNGSCIPLTGTGTFTLEPDAAITLCHPQGVATTGAFGQIQSSGTRFFSPGANYTYSGSSAQTTGTGLPFNLSGSLTINNGGAGVDLDNDLNLSGVLNLVNGDLRLTPELGMFTIISNPAGTGAVVNQNGAVIGSAIVQRFINGTIGALGYRHLSSPVAAAPVSDLATVGFTPVVNNLYNTATYPKRIRPYPNVFAFDESRFPATGDFQPGYFSPAAPASILEPGRGYTVYIRGGLTTDFNGTLTTGNVLRSGLTHTGSFNGPLEKSGWHLTGNPYASPIDWDLVTIPAGLSPSVFVWQSAGGLEGAYVPYINGSGMPGTQLIAMGQGMFIRVIGAGPVDFTFTNACRVANTNVPVNRTASMRPQLTLSLRATDAPDTRASDAYVYFQDGATADYDVAFDAPRPDRNVGLPTLATLTGAEEMAVNALSPDALTAGARLPLLVDVPTAGTYELAVRELRHLTEAAVYLLDARTGTEQRLTASSRYTFMAEEAGAQTARFTLRFGAATATTAAQAVTIWPNPATNRAQVHLDGTAESVSLMDAVGRTVRTVKLAAAQTVATFQLAGLPAGVYTVRAGAATTRLVVE